MVRGDEKQGQPLADAVPGQLKTIRSDFRRPERERGLEGENTDV